MERLNGPLTEEILKALSSWGANPEEAIRRLSGDEEFYLCLLRKFCGSKDWEELTDWIRSGNWEKAYIVAHRMKGSAADLALDPITRMMSDLNSALRDNTNTEIPNQEFQQLYELWKELRKMIPNEGKDQDHIN